MTREPWQTFNFESRTVFVHRRQKPDGSDVYAAETEFAPGKTISVVADTIEEALFGLGHAIGVLA